MSSTTIIWLEFLACVAVIGVAGTYLSRYGDVIAEKTGWGGKWIGLVLLATVTSLPELITGVSAVTLAGTPDIALGDALGSCVFNLFIIVMLDFLHRGESVYTRASQGHILAAGFGTLLIGFVGFNVLIAGHVPAWSVWHVGLYTPVIVVVYLIAMRMLYQYEHRERAAYTEERAERYPGVTLRQAVTRYAIAALAVIAAGTLLPFIGEALARTMGWAQSFVGTLFVAFATSVPEVVVTVAALRIGALDMAISNLFGSNLFDILIVAIDDLLYLPGPILSDVSSVHAVTAMSAVMMTSVTVVGLLYRPRGRILKFVGWTSLLLLSLYLLNTFVLYLHGAN
jgi:cation:H+ antiporter